MKTYSVFLALLIVVTVVAIVLPSLFRKQGMPIIMSANERYFYKKIEQIPRERKDAIPLNILTNFKWDKVCFYASYSPTEERTYLDFYYQEEKVTTIYGFQREFIKKLGKHSSFGALASEQPCFNNDVRIYLQASQSYLTINYIY